MSAKVLPLPPVSLLGCWRTRDSGLYIKWTLGQVLMERRMLGSQFWTRAVRMMNLKTNEKHMNQ